MIGGIGQQSVSSAVDVNSRCEVRSIDVIVKPFSIEINVTHMLVLPGAIRQIYSVSICAKK